ncbi:MAG TPA: hypothetical protein VFQ67_13420 [Allosphingosinicella sp.]|jgi:hypothetical protein|nr:hypothetical protein [Allosphingosinicella sp.]
MPTTIFDWIARTAMLAMAGLVTLSILGAVATMTNDPGTGFAAGDRPRIEGEGADRREAGQAPPAPGDGNLPAAGRAGARGVAAPPPPPTAQDRQARWLEAIAYALLAIAGIGALGVLMLWSMVRELRRIGRAPR